MDQPTTPGRINVWDPPSVFEWRWEDEVLRWELEPVGGGTVLDLTVRVEKADDGHLVDAAAGYHVCLDHLRELLDTGSAGPIATADPGQFTQRYAEMVTATSGT